MTSRKHPVGTSTCSLLAHTGDASGIGRQLEAQLCACAAALSHEQKSRLAAWLAEVPPELFGARVVRPLQRHVSALAARQVRGSAFAGSRPCRAAPTPGCIWYEG